VECCEFDDCTAHTRDGYRCDGIVMRAFAATAWLARFSAGAFSNTGNVLISRARSEVAAARINRMSVSREVQAEFNVAPVRDTSLPYFRLRLRRDPINRPGRAPVQPASSPARASPDRPLIASIRPVDGRETRADRVEGP
jgi:hypothetical protein